MRKGMSLLNDTGLSETGFRFAFNHNETGVWSERTASRAYLAGTLSGPLRVGSRI